MIYGLPRGWPVRCHETLRYLAAFATGMLWGRTALTRDGKRGHTSSLEIHFSIDASPYSIHTLKAYSE